MNQPFQIHIEFIEIIVFENLNPHCTHTHSKEGQNISKTCELQELTKNFHPVSVHTSCLPFILAIGSTKPETVVYLYVVAVRHRQRRAKADL